MGIKVSNTDTFLATTTYAAVLVVFIGTGGPLEKSVTSFKYSDSSLEFNI
jgi:hypothetical protein